MVELIVQYFKTIEKIKLFQFKDIFNSYQKNKKKWKELLPPSLITEVKKSMKML